MDETPLPLPEVEAPSLTEDQAAEVLAEAEREPAPEPPPRPKPRTLAELAERAGVEVRDLYDLEVPLADHGPAKLGTLKDQAQRLKHAERLVDEAAEARQQAYADVQRLQKDFMAQMASLDAVIRAEGDRLTEADRHTDWERLRQQNPAEYAAARQVQRDMQERLEQLKANARESIARYQQQQQHTHRKWIAEQLKREDRALQQAIPEWRDANRAQSEKQKVRQYLTSLGFGDHEISHLADHRAVLIARKAMLYDEMSKARPSAERKRESKVARRVLSPSSRDAGDGVHGARLQSLRGTLKKSGSLDDAARYLRELERTK